MRQTALERAALCHAHAREARFKLGWMIVPADGTGRCQLDEAETSVRRRFFLQLGQITDLPVTS